jgi:hypothetical protein
MSDTKRKTRLKGTENQKPCFDCGVTKDRFKDFKPRWAGCATHRTERGRRYHKAGCAECEKIVNGNIRQPRCIGCDKQRPKKQAEATGTVTVTPTVEAPVFQPGPQVEAALQAEAAGVVEVVSVEPASTEVQAAVRAVVLPEPVVVATPEPEAAPAPEAVAVTVPAPVAAQPRKKVASKADLFAMFADEGDTKAPF